MPSASLIRTAAGGVFVMNVNERSSYTRDLDRRDPALLAALRRRR